MKIACSGFPGCLTPQLRSAAPDPSVGHAMGSCRCPGSVSLSTASSASCTHGLPLSPGVTAAAPVGVIWSRGWIIIPWLLQVPGHALSSPESVWKGRFLQDDLSCLWQRLFTNTLLNRHCKAPHRSWASADSSAAQSSALALAFGPSQSENIAGRDLKVLWSKRRASVNPRVHKM